MKKFLAITSLVLILTAVYSQNPNSDYRFSIKLNNLTSFEEYRMNFMWGSTPGYWDFSNNSFINPTLSLQLNTRSNFFHELEFISIYVGKTLNKRYTYSSLMEDYIILNGQEINEVNFSARYIIAYDFLKNSDSKLIPSIGFGVNPEYFSIYSEPVVAISYPITEKLMAVRLQLIPKLSYSITPKLFVDMSIPVSLFDYKYFIYKVDNVTLLEELRTITSDKWTFLPKHYSGSIGIGLRF